MFDVNDKGKVLSRDKKYFALDECHKVRILGIDSKGMPCSIKNTQQIILDADFLGI